MQWGRWVGSCRGCPNSRSRSDCGLGGGDVALLVLQQPVDHGTERHRRHRLVQEVVAAGARFAKPRGGGVAGDDEGRNWRAHALRRCSIDSIPILPSARRESEMTRSGGSPCPRAGDRGIFRCRGHHEAAPALQDAAHTVRTRASSSMTMTFFPRAGSAEAAVRASKKFPRAGLAVANGTNTEKRDPRPRLESVRSGDQADDRGGRRWPSRDQARRCGPAPPSSG